MNKVIWLYSIRYVFLEPEQGYLLQFAFLLLPFSVSL